MDSWCFLLSRLLCHATFPAQLLKQTHPDILTSLVHDALPTTDPKNCRTECKIRTLGSVWTKPAMSERENGLCPETASSHPRDSSLLCCSGCRRCHQPLWEAASEPGAWRRAVFPHSCLSENTARAGGASKRPNSDFGLYQEFAVSALQS